MTEMDPRRYYDRTGQEEWERLAKDPVTRMEFENTVDVLSADLPAEGRVLDVGGGPGRYAVWLAERGYEVVHADLSRTQVELAREKVAEHGQAAAHGLADVRSLPFRADAFDAVCCLGGVLSHVLSERKRREAVRELRRVARDGAPVFVSVIGRIGAVLNGLHHRFPEDHRLLELLMADGDYTADRVEEHAGGEGWAEAHFFRAAELEALLSAAFDVERLVGLEGVAANFREAMADAPGEAVDSVRSLVADHREDRTMADVSHHIFAACRARESKPPG